MNTEESGTTDSQAIQGQQQSIFGLKEIRESRGIDIQTIVEATKVSPQMLQALEGFDFSKLPEPFYTKAFLKSYARELGIDSTPLIERYDSYWSTREVPDNKYDHLKKRRNRRSILPRIVLAIIVVGFASLAGYYFWWNQSNWYPTQKPSVTATNEGVTTDQAQTAAEETALDSPESPPPSTLKGSDDPVVEPPQEEPMEDARENGETGAVATAPSTEEVIPEPLPAKPEQASDELVLEIGASELTWLQIIRDDEPPEQLYLRAGSLITRRAETRFDIIVGNAGGVEIVFQGSFLGSIGSRGEVVSLRLPGNESPLLKPD